MVEFIFRPGNKFGPKFDNAVDWDGIFQIS